MEHLPEITDTEKLLRANAIEFANHVGQMTKRIKELEDGIFKYCLEITNFIENALPNDKYDRDACILCDSHYVIFANTVQNNSNNANGENNANSHRKTYGGSFCVNDCDNLICSMCKEGEENTCSVCKKTRCNNHIRKIVDKIVCFDCEWKTKN